MSPVREMAEAFVHERNKMLTGGADYDSADEAGMHAAIKVLMDHLPSSACARVAMVMGIEKDDEDEDDVVF